MNEACTLLARQTQTRIVRSTLPVRLNLAQLMVLKDERRVTYVGDQPYTLVEHELRPIRIVVGHG